MAPRLFLEKLPELVASVQNAVVHVSNNAGSGAGFAIPLRADDHTAGVIVTNAHVVEDDPTSVRIHTTGQADQRVRVRLLDRSTDLALLQLRDPASSVLPPRDVDLRAGEAVIAIGSPLGYEGSVSFGIISALGRRGSGTDGAPFDGVIQTDAAINHGNSGGPLIDLAGRVIGVNQAIDLTEGGQNISFAIPIDFALDVYAEVCETGTRHIRRASLGLRTGTHRFDANTAARLKRPSGAGILGHPRRGSPAENAGLREGDVITSLDNQDVPGSAALFRLLDRHRIGTDVPVEYVRRGKSRTAIVTPVERQN